MEKRTIIRILCALIIAASLIWGYWWITWSLAIIFLFYFPNYYEVLLWGVAYDALYGGSCAFTIMSFLLISISFFVKKRLALYTHHD